MWKCCAATDADMHHSGFLYMPYVDEVKRSGIFAARTLLSKFPLSLVHMAARPADACQKVHETGALFF